jgi:hypothetical protein
MSASTRLRPSAQEISPAIALIQTRIPWWLKSAPLAQRQVLQAAITESHAASQALRAIQAGVKSVEAFAAPLLQAALDREFGPGLDVNQDRLRHVHLIHRGSVSNPRQESVVDQSLLHAALQNFESSETELDGFAPGSAIHRAWPATLRRPLTLQAFAKLCRRLDLGDQYWQHLQGLYASIAQSPAARGRQAVVKTACTRSIKADLLLNMHIAFMRKRFANDDVYPTLLRFIEGDTAVRWDGAVVEPCELRMLDIDLTTSGTGGNLRGSVLFRRAGDEQGPCVLYVPGDPEKPLQGFTTSAECYRVLTNRLRTERYREFFRSLLHLRSEALFFPALADRLAPYNATLKRRVADGDADLGIKAQPMFGGLLPRLYQHQMLKMFDDASTLAVSTDTEDRISRRKRYEHYLNWGNAIANVLALFVPGLGEALLVVAGAQLVEEVFHGVELWQHHEKSQAVLSVMSVLVNLELLAITGVKGSAGVPKPDIHGEAFLDPLLEIEVKPGIKRLWNGDLAAYRSSSGLPAGTAADTRGVYSTGGKTFIKLRGELHGVKLDAATGKWSIPHPTDTDGLALALEHNQAGAWRLAAERPLDWDALTSLRRLGAPFTALDDRTAQAVMDASGVDESLLREVHLDHNQPPALLADCAQRLELDSEVSQYLADRGQAAEPTQTPLQRHLASVDTGSVSRTTLQTQAQAFIEKTDDASLTILKQQHPGLSNADAQELLAGLSEAQRVDIASGKPLPLRASERARWYLAQGDVSRALEGFHRPTLASADTDRLALHWLEQLPGWDPQVRMEIRERSPSGTFVDGIGPQQAHIRKVLVKNEGLFQAHDESGNALHAVFSNHSFFSAVLHALPNQQRQALGFGIHAAEPLERAVVRLAERDREHSAALLRLRLVQPDELPPYRPKWQREVLQQGQASSRETQVDRRIKKLYPTMTTAQLDEFTFAARRAGSTALHEVQRLEAEFTELQQQLQAWTRARSHRTNESGERVLVSATDKAQAAERILQAWQRRSRPMSLDNVVEGFELNLADLRLGELPALTATFEHVGLLDISSMGLRTTPETFMAGFKSLKVLNMSSNHLNELPRALSEMRSLQVLRMSNNRLALSATEVSRLARLRKLGNLRLDRNRLELSAADFQQLGSLPRLKSLNLARNRITLTVEGRDHLAGLRHLRALSLEENPLGLAPDVGAMRELRQLNLQHTRITEWPRGLFNLRHLQAVNLTENRIAVVPAQVTTTQNMLVNEVTDISGNPLDAASRDRVQAYVDEHGLMGLSLDGLPAQAESITAGATAAQLAQWSALSEQPGSTELINLLQRMSETRDFRDMPREVRRRVWAVVDTLNRYEDVRLEVFDAAQNPDHCGDRVQVQFSLVELKVLVKQAQISATRGGNTDALLKLAKGLFRLDELDKELAKVIDFDGLESVEKALYYRTRLARRLDLPGQPTAMDHAHVGKVSESQLDAVAKNVEKLEAGAQMKASIVQREFWQTALQQKYPQRFADMRLPTEVQLEALIDEQEVSEGESAKRLREEPYNAALIISDNDYMQRLTAIEQARAQAGSSLVGELTTLEMGGDGQASEVTEL